MEPDPARGQWQHDLRNAVNSALLSVTVAKRLLEQGATPRANLFIDDALRACERAQQLLEASPQELPPPGDAPG